jgi:hypothetical protein
MKLYIYILISLFNVSTIFCQNISYSQEITNNMDGTSTVDFYITNTGVTSEDFAAFTIIYYYDNSETSISSVDFNTVSTSWNWGIANQTITNHIANFNPSSPITHTGYFSYDNLDNNGFDGETLNSGEVRLIGSITFNHAIGTTQSGSGWLPNNPQVNNYQYSGGDFVAHNVTTTGIQFGPLPIKMKSFSAIKDGERASRLDWVTSSEINSDYFGVERSADGNTWEQIGQVAAAGNSNTDIAYQFLDRKLPSFRAGENIFYYRLKLTDLDGQYKYSDVRGVNFGKLSNSIISIYPNPTTEIINVDISGMSLDAGDVTLSVFDMNGRNMISKNIIGNGIELIEVDQYPSGTYNVVVQQGETIQQKKIIKID